MCEGLGMGGRRVHVCQAQLTLGCWLLSRWLRRGEKLVYTPGAVRHFSFGSLCRARRRALCGWVDG